MDENAEKNHSFPLGSQKPGGIPPIGKFLICFTTLLVVGAILGNLMWFLVSDVLAFNREDMAVQITVSPGDSLIDISKNLKAGGLIRYPWFFRLYARISELETAIRPGSYTLQTRYDYHALVKALCAGPGTNSAFEFHQGEKMTLCRN